MVTKAKKSATLQAQAESWAKEFEALYTLVTTAWGEQFAKFDQVPVQASYVFQDDVGVSRLSWTKFNKRWTFCIDHVEGKKVTEVIPYENWSFEERLAMLLYVDNLAEQVDQLLTDIKAELKGKL